MSPFRQTYMDLEAQRRRALELQINERMGAGMDVLIAYIAAAVFGVLVGSWLL